MSGPISDRLFLDYLQCKYKAYLKLSGKSGTKGDYAKYQDDQADIYRRSARNHFQQSSQITPYSETTIPFKDLMKQKSAVATDVSITNDRHSLLLDAIELTSTSQKLVYQPVIFLPHYKITKIDKLSLAFCGLALSHEQKTDPTSGRIILGDKFSSSRIQLPLLIKAAGKIEKEIFKMKAAQTAPPLRLNDHCKTCEFQTDCLAAANEKDDLSLLKGLSGKEIDSLNKRGIFTITQYSYTFRPRRARKLAAKKIVKYHYSLNALALRTQMIYIVAKPELSTAPTRVYFDVEGIPDENIYYLIGVLIDDGTSIIEHSLWANDKSEERSIWNSFLEIIAAIPDYALIHYGSYETRFIKQMELKYGGNKELIERIKSRSFNVLSAIYGRIYFPTYSNDLKSVASLAGFKWTGEQVSGLMSILWRTQWCNNRDATLKNGLITYNKDDCMALRIVDSSLRSITGDENAALVSFPTKYTDELKAEKPLGIFKRNQFVNPELELINKRAYFDYQRSKVYLRTSALVKKAVTKENRAKRASYRVNKEISFDVPKRCPLCNKKSPIKHSKRSRIVYDLSIFKSGVKRWVVKYKCPRCLCRKCNKTFFPAAYQKISGSKYGQNLFSWIIYQHVGRLISQNSIIEDLGEVFGYWFPWNVVAAMKEVAASRYQETYDKLLTKMLDRNLLHVDETRISIKGANNYVWAITNMESVVYIYSATREDSMIKDKLSAYKGVLVTDFYTAYDSIPCIQQKCLIHLIRDMNEDLLKNPFDEELREMAKDFTSLMSSIVATIDKYGLKQYHMNKHKTHAGSFLKKVQDTEYSSDFAENYQRRFVKYGVKMFTFLDFDGVPWNNNNAEHAIKRVAKLRNAIGGSSTAKGAQEYLVLLSICETLRLRNASFLKFLTSGATDVDDFLMPHKNMAA